MYIADAHALAWYFTDDPRLGREAAEVFERSARGECLIIIPAIVLAEFFHISRKKRIVLDFAELLRRVEENSNLSVTSLDLSVIRKLPATLPLAELHDQIIVATALFYEGKVLTRNGAIQASALVETVW
jgi:predicted nucleic acid-binding protein